MTHHPARQYIPHHPPTLAAPPPCSAPITMPNPTFYKKKKFIQSKVVMDECLPVFNCRAEAAMRRNEIQPSTTALEVLGSRHLQPSVQELYLSKIWGFVEFILDANDTDWDIVHCPFLDLTGSLVSTYLPTLLSPHQCTGTRYFPSELPPRNGHCPP